MRRLLYLTGWIVLVDSALLRGLDAAPAALRAFARARQGRRRPAGRRLSGRGALRARSRAGSSPPGSASSRPCWSRDDRRPRPRRLLLGLAHAAWEPSTSPASPGHRQLVLVDRRARLARPPPRLAGRRGRLIGQAFAAAVGGALLGPVLGGIASVAGTGWTFGVVAAASLGVAAWAAATPAARPERPQGLRTLLHAPWDAENRLGWPGRRRPAGALLRDAVGARAAAPLRSQRPRLA